jgi:hypothetical protein
VIVVEANGATLNNRPACRRLATMASLALAGRQFAAVESLVFQLAALICAQAESDAFDDTGKEHD